MEMKKAGKVQYLEPQALARSGSAVMGFTTRHEGVSRPPYNSLNLGTNTFDSPHSVEGNRSVLTRAFGAGLEQLVTVKQVHGTDLLVIDSPNPDYTHFHTLECDGIITNQPQVMIATPTAIERLPVATLAIQMQPLLAPVLPPAFEFAVIDPSGLVQFHSDPQRNHPTLEEMVSGVTAEVLSPPASGSRDYSTMNGYMTFGDDNRPQSLVRKDIICAGAPI